MEPFVASRIKVTPVNPLIGATVDPGDLRTASDAVIEEVRSALHTHQVVFLRGQHLYDDELLAVARRFGRPMETPIALFRDEGIVSTFEISLKRPPRADIWHTDISFYEAPPTMAFMSNVIAPEIGGDTMFASSYEAYNALSPSLQQWVRTLKGVHTYGGGLREFAVYEGGEAAGKRLDDSFPPREQPLVIRHPQTGRLALYVTTSFLDYVAGLKPSESEALLRLLRAPYDDPNFQARWRWQPGDLIIWDQRAVNHRGLSDHFPSHPQRKMQTVFVTDDVAVADLAA